jgi:glycosyltransferase involved in cell wall biosynthesis
VVFLIIDMMAKVSIVLTSYNRPRLLQEAVGSVLAQTLTDWQLIIVDDNSGMPTVAVLSALDDPRIKKIRTRVRDEKRALLCRYAVCINIGLHFVTGDYVTYLTDDDLYLPHRLERMVAELDTHPDRHVVYGEQQIQHWVGESGVWAGNGIRRTVGVTHSPMCQVDHNSFMHRRDCLKEIGGKPWWPENPGAWKAADAGFFARLARLHPFHPITEVLDVHRCHPNQIQARMDRRESPVYVEEI